MQQSTEITSDGTNKDRYDPYVVLGRLLGRIVAQDFFGAYDLRRQFPLPDSPQSQVVSAPPAPVDNA
jgi:hypothetical protein